MPMVIAVSTSWGMGIPAAVVIGFVLGLDGPGIWAGFAVAMMAAACLLMRSLGRQARQFAAET